MKKFIKFTLCVIAFLCFAGMMSSTDIEAKDLTPGTKYKKDLNGDGKKEKIKYTCKTIYNVDTEVTHYDFKLFINGEVVLKESGDEWDLEGIYIQLVDINPKDKYLDIIIYSVDGHTGWLYGYKGYRYDEKLKLIFESEGLKFYDGQFDNIASKQEKNNNVCFIHGVNTVAGGLYIKCNYKIKDKKLVFVRPKENVYKVVERKLEVRENLYLCSDKDLLDWTSRHIYPGEYITIKKLKFADDDIHSGNFLYPEIVSAYVKSSEGAEGWIDMNWNRYENLIVYNEASFIPM